ncbi:KOW motif-containing protein [Candidatus Karelsulcia muelleri]
MKLKKKDNILINSGNYKGKKGKVRKIIKKKTRALVELFNKDEGKNEGKKFQLIEMDLSNLLLIYRPSSNVLTYNNFYKLQKFLTKMRKINNKLNYLFSIEELNNLLKIRDLENIKEFKRKNELLP